MFKILIISLFVVQCFAVPLRGYGGYGLGLSDGKLGGIGLNDGYGLGLVRGCGGLGGGCGGGTRGLGLSNRARVNAAILSQRSVQVIPTASNYGVSAPTVVDIDSSEQPVVLNFNSRSSSLLVKQNHLGRPGSKQSSASVDEPNILTHEVTRPVIQEIREVIVPQRNIVQEIRPVIENVQTLVAQGDNRRDLGEGLSLGRGIGNGLSLGSNKWGGISDDLDLSLSKEY